MGLRYKYSKFLISTKQRYKENKYKKALAKLNVEQLKVFNLVMDLAIKNNNCIRFDPKIEETLIVMPEILITITKYKVVIQNSHGFLTTQFRDDAYEIMDEALTKEAHKERRKLKHDVKIRINQFLNKIKVDDIADEDIELFKF